MARSSTRSKAAIRALADKRGITYAQARTLYTSPEHQPAQDISLIKLSPAATTLEELLRAEVDGWCADRMFSDIEDLPEFSTARDDLEWHEDLEEPSVHELTPDLESVDASVVETYEGGAQAVNGSFAATLRVEGYLPRTEAHFAAGTNRVHILDADFNERFAEILDRGEGRLEFDFSAVVDTGGETVDDFEVFEVRAIGWTS